MIATVCNHAADACGHGSLVGGLLVIVAIAAIVGMLTGAAMLTGRS